LPNINTKRRGNLQIRIKANIPRYDKNKIEKIINFKNGI